MIEKVCFICLGAWLALSLVHVTSASDNASDPIALSADESSGRLYVLEATGQRVTKVDTASHTIADRFTLPVSLTGLALSRDGKALYVTGGVAEGRIFVLDANTGNVRATWQGGHWPCAPVLGSEGKHLFVCNRFSNEVSVVDTATGERKTSLSVIREPTAGLLTADGQHLYILNLLPAGRSDADYTAGAISVIDVSSLQVARTIALPNGSNQLLGICLSPDGRYAYITHLLARYQLPTTQLERGWVNTNAVTVVDTQDHRRVNTVLLDDIGQGAANPWGIVCSKDGDRLCVALSGTDEILLVDRKAMHQRLDQALKDKSVEDVPNNLAFLAGIKKRIQLPGKGFRALTRVGSKLYTAGTFTDNLCWLDLKGGPRYRPESLALATTEAVSLVRQGEILFNDANICFQKWQSCASCHPSDARIDGLNWDLMNDGLGNPKNTKSMLLSHATPPSMSLGVRSTAEEAVRAGIRHILFLVRPESEAAAMDAYLKSLKPVPSPYLAKKGFAASAQRGRLVFGKANCARCHSGDLFTNNKSYDAGTGLHREKGKKFDTPTLVEVWRTAPYLHDGRAETLMEVLTTFNADDKHGKTSELSEQELTDLENYLLGL